ncbi:membrane protein, partial [Candidatus Thiomargarita nelsonii]
MTELTLLSAFLAGLLGSAHCIGMCGGIVGLLTMNLSDNVRQSFFRLLPYLLSYNLGRIGSYTLAGLCAGFLGAQFA